MTQIPPTAALPMPADGWRRLSAQQVQRRAQAMACLRDNTPQCQGQVHVNLFFDGTGNNWNWEGVFVTGKRRSTQTQLARNGHSNITRLWRISPQESENGFFSFYYPGVGTPFPEIRDSGDGFLDGTLGAAAARHGVNRINWGIIQTYNALHRYVHEVDLIIPDDARKLVHKMSSVNSMAGERVLRNQWVYEIRARLEGALQSAQRKVTSINIAVFGFSRGAAQARAFVHWLFDSAQHWNTGNGPNLAGVPMRLTFLGIFDTVASVGVAGISRVFEGHSAWAGGELMNIHPGVEKCVHFVALHEQRINFPVDLADRGKQVLYPGMHSDVGGGYTPGSQGKDFVDGKPQGGAKLSQIPLIDMYHEAVKAGVPLMSIEEIAKEPLLAPEFSCHPQLIADYNAWLTGHGVAGGSHAEQIKGHARQYVQWKGLRMWEGPQSEPAQPYHRQSDDEDQYDLDNARRDFAALVDRLNNLLNKLKPEDEIAERYKTEYRNRREAWLANPRGPAPLQPRPKSSDYVAIAQTKELLRLVLARQPIAPAATRLFDNYVHDSLAGFYLGKGTELNTFPLATTGYLRYRTVFKTEGPQAGQAGAAAAAAPAAEAGPKTAAAMT